MLSKVQQWGNTIGIGIPKSLLNDFQLKAGEEVNLSTQHDKIIIELAKTILDRRGKYDINELVARMPKDYKPKEENWGEPVGCEVW